MHPQSQDNDPGDERHSDSNLSGLPQPHHIDVHIHHIDQVIPARSTCGPSLSRRRILRGTTATRSTTASEAATTQAREAFLEGHVAAFTELGGTPIHKIRYDNLKAAVSRVLFGRGREESARWTAFKPRFGFDAFYCEPGVAGVHEKGGVEGEGGRFRRNHCVPMPKVDSIAELNELLIAADAKDEHRRIENRAQSVGHDFAFEQETLRTLPSEVFPT